MIPAISSSPFILEMQFRTHGARHTDCTLEIVHICAEFIITLTITCPTWASDPGSFLDLSCFTGEATSSLSDEMPPLLFRNVMVAWTRCALRWFVSGSCDTGLSTDRKYS